MDSTAEPPGRVLVVPDIHQNVAWAERVLAVAGAVDRVVFLGDYFDPASRDAASVGETCAWLVRVREMLGGRATFLLGNHDIQYLEAKPWCERHGRQRQPKYACGSAYSHSRARRIAKLLPVEFWHGANLCTAVHGRLLSHAGVARAFWSGGSTDEALSTLQTRCATALATFRGSSDSLLLPGPCRGGTQPIGGITWLDWDEEFDDTAIPLPQIVGHTSNPVGARQKGRSWCLDGRQTTFALLEGGGLTVCCA